MIFVDSTSAKQQNHALLYIVQYAISYNKQFISKELTSLPLGEAESLRTSISSGIWQLVVSQVFCLPLVMSIGVGQQSTLKGY